MLLNILLTILLNKFTQSVIVLPIYLLPKENYKHNTKNLSIYEKTIDSLYKSHFYTLLELGDPIQKIPVLIKTELNSFIINSFNSIKNSSSYNYIDTFNISELFYINNNFSFYDEKKSKSFILNKCDYSKFYEAEQICDCNETFIFYKDLLFCNKTKKDKIYFQLTRNAEDNITGEIGLNLYDKNKMFYNSFLNILKKYNFINNYNWYFDYNNTLNNGHKLIIGVLPHELYPNIYSENQLFYTKAISNNYMIYWRIKFNKIMAVNSDMFASLKYFEDTDIEFKFDSDIIIATEDYSNYIFKIFNTYFINKKCFNSSINDYKDYSSKLIFIYCKYNKNFFFELSESLLPTIYLYSIDFNYTFEIDSDDILFIKNDYIYLRILFNDNKIKNKIWKLGKPFSLKYKFVFNPETKQVGFYNKDYSNEAKNKKILNDDNGKDIKKDITIKIFIIVIFGILLIYLLFKTYKIISNIKRQKRKNEIIIINDYKYYSQNNIKEMNIISENNK